MRRVRDPDLLALLHLEASECALTGAVDRLEAHHILGRAQGGDDVRANIVMLNRDVHWRITINEPVARKMLGEYVMRERLDFVTYLTMKLGPEQASDWLERRLLVDTAILTR